jgi:CrcB protein
MRTALAVAGGAAIGAPCRYLLDRAVQARHDRHFPFGTLLINLLGSGVLGVLLGWSAGAAGVAAAVGSSGSGAALASPVVLAAVGIGWCGAFTTYSTFGFETVQLAREGLFGRALANIVISVGGGLGMAVLGVTIGQALNG